MKRYNIKGVGNVWWVQERVLWWWSDIHHGSPDGGPTQRREYQTFSDALIAVEEYRKQNAAAKARAPRWLRWLLVVLFLLAACGNDCQKRAREGCATISDDAQLCADYVKLACDTE